jgi:hypothetical protein
MRLITEPCVSDLKTQKEGGRSMLDLIEPIARLKDVLNELDALPARQDHIVPCIKAACCHLQFAIDLLDEAQSAET